MDNYKVQYVLYPKRVLSFWDVVPIIFSTLFFTFGFLLFTIILVLSLFCFLFGLVYIGFFIFYRLNDSKSYIEQFVINGKKLIIHYYFKNKKQPNLEFNLNEVKIEFFSSGPGNYRGACFKIYTNNEEVIRQYPYGEWDGVEFEFLEKWFNKIKGPPKYVQYPYGKSTKPIKRRQ